MSSEAVNFSSMDDQSLSVDPVATSTTVVRHIMENALFSNTEIEAAFMELMAATKAADPDGYDMLRRLARQNSGLQASWRLILIDVMLSMNLAELTDDDEVFALTANAICRPRQVPGAETVFKACVRAYDGIPDDARIIVVQKAILGDL